MEQKENDMMTRVGPATPAGETLAALLAANEFFP